MLPQPDRPTLATHWGTYRVRMEAGRPVALDPFEADPDPSPIASAMLEARTAPARILRPSVRRSFLERGHAAGGEGRGREPLVEVGWDEALALVAGELDRVRSHHGNGAIYGGSYGWASAGRFHHAQSQVHRFLNTIGGYTRSVQNYSFAAADTILPHVIGDRRGLASGHTPWRLLAGHAELIVMFGGASPKNAQVSSGGLSRHALREGILACRDKGAELVSISPIRDDTALEAGAQWWAPRPQSDVALMLGLCHTLLSEGLHDRDFLARCTTGFAEVEAYLTGAADGTPKTADWAASLCEIPADEIRALARRMAAKRTFIMMSWSLQRADHGEQPYWMAITLAAMLGQIGLPGGGYGYGLGAIAYYGRRYNAVPMPTFSQGKNPISDYIPVARISDMLLNPGATYRYNGQTRTYPEIKLVYWAGGNPFHHHQDLNRLRQAFARIDTLVVHELAWTATARHADIVLPCTMTLEREDIGGNPNDPLLVPMHPVVAPYGEARDDYAIFADLAERLGTGEAFTEGRTARQWLEHLYEPTRAALAAKGLPAPSFAEFWAGEGFDLPQQPDDGGKLRAFRTNPDASPLPTPSGKLEIFSETIAGFGEADCPGHPTWLGATNVPDETNPYVLVANQPRTRLHSQFDFGGHSSDAKHRGREVAHMHPDDAALRGIADGDIIRLSNERGACLAAVHVTDGIRKGVIQLPTGAWYDPVDPNEDKPLCVHGNPNVLTRDIGTSALAQGCTGQLTTVQVARFDGNLPPIQAFDPPGSRTVEAAE